jgi:nitroreductase
MTIQDAAQFADQLIASRRTVLPKRLIEPGPSEAEIERLFVAASAAPDHAQTLPWRFLIIPKHMREALGELFAKALLERDASATDDHLIAAREKALRSPLLMLVCVRDEPLLEQAANDVDLNERVLSAGCAVQNILLMAASMGYGSSLTSGQALKSECFRAGLGLSSAEHAICFINIGTTGSERLPRRRPRVDEFVKVWQISNDGKRLIKKTS